MPNLFHREEELDTAQLTTETTGNPFYCMNNLALKPLDDDCRESVHNNQDIKRRIKKIG
jgi:hypothetical protein